jgi:hypothetical protein
MCVTNHGISLGLSLLLPVGIVNCVQTRKVVALLLRAAGEPASPEQEEYVNFQNWQGQTALMIAAMHGNTRGVALLLMAGADANLCTANQETALMMAARNGSTAVAKLLVAAKANVLLEDADGVTAVAMAESYGWGASATFLHRMESNSTRMWHVLQSSVTNTLARSSAFRFDLMMVEMLNMFPGRVHGESAAHAVRKLQRVQAEIVETEQNYVDELKTIEEYHNLLTPLLSEDETTTLFSHRTLLNGQAEFCRELEALDNSGANPGQLAKAISEFLTSHVKEYSRYCGMLRPAKELYTELCKREEFVLCSFFDQSLHSNMPLVPTHAHLKLEHACVRMACLSEALCLFSGYCEFLLITVGGRSMTCLSGVPALTDVINLVNMLKAIGYNAARRLGLKQGQAPRKGLDSLIYHPLQRIARYPMFLERLGACTVNPSTKKQVFEAETAVRYGAAFSTGIYTRGCQWLPRLLA